MYFFFSYEVAHQSPPSIYRWSGPSVKSLNPLWPHQSKRFGPRTDSHNARTVCCEHGTGHSTASIQTWQLLISLCGTAVAPVITCRWVRSSEAGPPCVAPSTLWQAGVAAPHALISSSQSVWNHLNRQIDSLYALCRCQLSPDTEACHVSHVRHSAQTKTQTQIEWLHWIWDNIGKGRGLMMIHALIWYCHFSCIQGCRRILQPRSPQTFPGHGPQTSLASGQTSRQCY